MKKYFITGLVTLLPLAITIWIVHAFVNFLTNPFLGIVTYFTNKLPTAYPKLIQTLSQLFILISLFVIVLVLGFVARRFFFKHLILLGDKLLIKIPLVSKVYKTSKDIVISLFGSTERSFKQVVLIPFPYKGAYCLGLIARTAPKASFGNESGEMISVFIPTTPNPSTGFLLVANKSDLTYIDMKTEEAIKYVVSCGVIQPHRQP